MSPQKTLSKFSYKALDADGRKVTGVEAAETQGAAHLALIDKGYQPLEVTEKKSVLTFEITKKMVPRKVVCLLYTSPSPRDS